MSFSVSVLKKRTYLEYQRMFAEQLGEEFNTPSMPRVKHTQTTLKRLRFLKSTLWQQLTIDSRIIHPMRKLKQKKNQGKLLRLH